MALSHPPTLLLPPTPPLSFFSSVTKTAKTFIKVNSVCFRTEEAMVNGRRLYASAWFLTGWRLIAPQIVFVAISLSIAAKPYQNKKRAESQSNAAWVFRCKSPKRSGKKKLYHNNKENYTSQWNSNNGWIIWQQSPTSVPPPQQLELKRLIFTKTGDNSVISHRTYEIWDRKVMSTNQISVWNEINVQCPHFIKLVHRFLHLFWCRFRCPWH